MPHIPVSDALSHSTQVHLLAPPSPSSSVHLQCKCGKGVFSWTGFGLPDFKFRADNTFVKPLILVHVLSCFSVYWLEYQILAVHVHSFLFKSKCITTLLKFILFFFLQKKSREESCGEGSGVEILENKPYTDGPGGTGQYTHKVYHIGMHIPSWFRSILPKAALRVEEESWNAYPYTRTRWGLLLPEGHLHTPSEQEWFSAFNSAKATQSQKLVGVHTFKDKNETPTCR